MRQNQSIRRGLTLAETMVSLVVLAVAVTAGVQSLGSFAAGARTWQERSVALELAAQLMSEINALPFHDPSGNTSIGRDAGETTGDRTTYDDIDDYDGWDESPPKDASGNAMSQYASYRRQVSVVFDNSLATQTGLTFPAGSFKKITVTILKDNKVLAQLVSVRASQSGTSQ